MNRALSLTVLAAVAVAVFIPRGAVAEKRMLVIRGDVLGEGVKDGAGRTTFTFKDRHSGKVVHTAVSTLEVKGGTYVAELDPGTLDPNGVYELESTAAPGYATFVALQTSSPGTPDVGHANISGTLIAGIFKGNGSQLTNIDAGAIASGVLNNSRLDSKVMLTFQNESINAVHTYTAKPAFNAAGSPFTVANTGKVANLNADLLDGLSASDLMASVPNPLTLSGSSTQQIIKGENTSTWPGSGGIYGLATASSGPTFGLKGQSNSTSGQGVYGLAGASTGQTQGVAGWTASTSGKGVYGFALASSGTSYGVYGETSSPSGIGVYGLGGTYGGKFKTAASTGIGLFGQSTKTTTATVGVSGEVASSTGTAVLGEVMANSGLNYGGHFVVRSPDAYGVLGEALADVSAETYGVAGKAAHNNNSFGIYAYGNSGASGTKAFRIDHPLDPANKYLLHYSAESPSPQNFYVGNVITDGKGQAWVQLPDYFEEVNKNFKYQLTVVDDSASGDFVQVKVGKRIKGNRFLIMTSAPNIAVSWEVKADRNDLIVRKMKPSDVVDKVGREKGTYQHPELYGLGPEKGILYDAEKARSRATEEKPRQ